MYSCARQVVGRLGWFLIVVLLLVFGCGSAVGASQKSTVSQLAIEPDSFYRLTFKTLGDADGVRWVIHMRTQEGSLPFDGVLRHPWQRLVAGQTDYSHAFLSARRAATLELIIEYDDALPQITDVVLEKVQPTHHILDGDLAGGFNEYSGWSKVSRAELVEHNGAAAMRVDTNGYVLGDYFPVVSGGGYRYVAGSYTYPGVSLLAFDENKRLIGRVANDFRKNPPIQMPVGAAYARLLLHTSHDHLPTHRVVYFTGAGLERLSEQPAASNTAISGDQAFGEIVLHPASDGRAERAAKELQYWISQITGKTLPLLAEATARPRLRLYVGGRWAAAYDSDLKALAGSDGYAVRRQGDDVYIFGASSRGTLLGVYAFLEKNTDIIWPRPQPQFEAIYSKQDTLSLSETDFRSRPAFWGRHVSNTYKHEDGYVFQDWMARNGLNSPHHVHKGLDYLSWARGAMVGYGGSYLSWADLGEGDEEFYLLVDGTRSISRWRQPCYTHPDLVDRLADRIRQRMATLEQDEITGEYMHITIADNWMVCSCSRCMSPITLPDGSVLAPQAHVAEKDPRFFSTRNFIMLNKVAEALRGEYPNLKLQTHAYIFAAEPPAGPIDPMILPEYAAYPTQNVRYPIMAGQGKKISIYDKDIWKRRFTQWDSKTAELGYFGYYYVAGFNAVADTAAVDYRDLLERGGIQAHTEGFPVDEEALSTWDIDSVEKWVIARLMWDPSQDPETLRQYYIQRVYREAAPLMAEFHEVVRQAWHDAPEDVFVNCHTSAQVIYEQFVVEPGLKKQMRDLLVRAHAAAVHPLSKNLIERKLSMFDDLDARFGESDVPVVYESTHDWSMAHSPHWEKAVVLEDFKYVDDWRQFNKETASHQTKVGLMHDGRYLYLRFTAYDDALDGLVVPDDSGLGVFPQGDRVEVMLRSEKGKAVFIAAGPNGAVWSHPNVDVKVATDRSTTNDAWVVMLAIALEDINWSPQATTILGRAGRVYRHDLQTRHESSLSGVSLFNPHDQFWFKLNVESR